jgi:hypothetical protein
MLEDLASAEDIAKATERLLARADARGRLPTPVDDIVAAAGLERPRESVLSDSALSRAPERLRVAMMRVRSKVLAVLDRRAREVHLNPSVTDHPGQSNFKVLHEVAHDILPWQSELAYADDRLTLDSATRILFEREANQGAAELLFQRNFFGQMAADYEIGCAAVIELADGIGSSMHAAFRRYVESHRSSLAGLVLDPSPCAVEPLSYRRRECFHSVAYTRRFGEPRCLWPATLRNDAYAFIGEVPCATSNMFPPRTEVALPDLNGEPTPLEVEVFGNSYSVFVLLWLPQRQLFKHRRVIAP